jgi:urease subunit alpha
MFGSFGGAVAKGSFTFVSQSAFDAGVAAKYGLAKNIAVSKNQRRITKRDMVHNALVPTMEIDAQTYAVRADGQLLTCEPAKVLPMAQRYFLF